MKWPITTTKKWGKNTVELCPIPAAYARLHTYIFDTDLFFCFKFSFFFFFVIFRMKSSNRYLVALVIGYLSIGLWFSHLKMILILLRKWSAIEWSGSECDFTVFVLDFVFILNRNGNSNQFRIGRYARIIFKCYIFCTTYGNGRQWYLMILYTSFPVGLKEIPFCSFDFSCTKSSKQSPLATLHKYLHYISILYCMCLNAMKVLSTLPGERT